MLQANQYGMSKALVSLAVEQSIIEAGGSMALEAVSNKMSEKHLCHLHDCYEHPEYLGTILAEMAASTSHTVVKLVRNRLEEFSYKGEIQGFLEKLNRVLNAKSSTVIIQ
ncbi:MAG TPA: hypothetical protein VJ792_03805 [Candidatus Nitrosotalea sp.]|nr:hypothetical protein [Candidatus Nitrosotalea sp.]